MPHNPNSRKTPSPLLAFGAHPDDIEFGCGAVIAAESQAGRPVHLVVCSRGESGTNGTPEMRASETDAAARALGATLEFADLGGDAHFQIDSPRTILLAAILRRVRPSIVLAPTIVDNQHPDHAVLGKLVRDACRLARYGGVAELKNASPHAIDHLLFYAVSPDAEPEGAARILVDVSAPAALAAWQAAMAAHASQQQTRNYVDLQLARARLLGLRIGATHAVALFPNDPLVFDTLAALSRSSRRF